MIRRQQKVAMKVLSLGGGTQSTVLALMAASGYLSDMPDIAIFADTGWEPKKVYDNIEWLKSILPFPVVTVSSGTSIRDDISKGVNARGTPWLSIPVYMSKKNGEQAGMNWRQCTTDYKITPILKKVREILGIRPRSPVPQNVQIEMWLGITSDETERVRTSPDAWIFNKYPLIDKDMTREDCIDWFNEKYPDRNLPRSACIGCPYHSRKGWADMLTNDPVSFEDAEEIDTKLRDTKGNIASRFRNDLFLHSSRKPLREAVELDIINAEKDSEGGWGNECAGICGV